VTACRALIDDIVKAAITPILRAADFKGSKPTWRRVRSDDVAVVNVQLSSANNASSGRFTINLGLELPRVREVLIGRRIADQRFDASDCVFQVRIGQLMAIQSDWWWHVDEGIDATGLIAEVSRTLGEDGLPWLDAGVDLERFGKLVEGRAGVQERAALALAAGQVAEAARMVENHLRAEPPDAYSHRLEVWWRRVSPAYLAAP
jgi:hypothetical protein